MNLKPSFIFRKPQVSDLFIIEAIQNQTKKTHWSRESIKNEIIQNHPASGIALSAEGEILGYIFIRSMDLDLEITSMAVDQPSQGQGVARGLIAKVVQEGKKSGAKRVLLEVSQENKPALSLYSSLGFKTGRKRPGYYPDGSDALEMALDI